MWFNGHHTSELYFLLYNIKTGNRYKMCGIKEMIYGKVENWCSDCEFHYDTYCYRYIKESVR